MLDRVLIATDARYCSVFCQIVQEENGRFEPFSKPFHENSVVACENAPFYMNFDYLMGGIQL
jgi:hypothetical protein